jgi:hypothetical protein
MLALPGTMIDLAKASEFMRTHARVLDLRRFGIFIGDGTSPEAALGALEGYANPDGGFGYGLEPDCRSTSSQPGGALHAFEVLADVAPATSPMAARLCDWANSVSFETGALPFAFAMDDGAGSAPFWAEADPSEPSMFLTPGIVGTAHRVAEHDPAVADHPWLAKATDYCLEGIADIDSAPMAIALRHALWFLDAVHDKRPEAPRELARLAAMLPASGTLPVPGGSEGEALRPLDFSPFPDRPLREHFEPGVIDADLDRLVAEQGADGGWHVDFRSYSPAAKLEWSGYQTAWAIQVLGANGRLG